MFGSTLSRAVFALLATVALGACADTPSSPRSLTPTISKSMGAEREVQEALYDLDGVTITYECPGVIGEEIQLTGKIFDRYTLMTTPSGGLHATINTMPVDVRGIGLTTGAEYRYTQRESGTFSTIDDAARSNYTNTVVLAAPSLGIRVSLTVGGHFTVNGNGEVVLERSVERGSCRV